jgi:hypothetical protein
MRSEQEIREELARLESMTGTGAKNRAVMSSMLRWVLGDDWLCRTPEGFVP